MIADPRRHSLIYVGDPLCSWCYGFALPLTATLASWPHLRVDLVMGGLRAFNKEVMDGPMKDRLRHHWDEVHRRSGQVFTHQLLARRDFIYDTEPACRAVVTVREHAPEHALAMHHAIQHAFYAEARDMTQSALLASVWAQLRSTLTEPPALDEAAFTRLFESPAMREMTREDFALAQRWGIRAYPTLLAVVDGQATVVANGYIDAAHLKALVLQVFLQPEAGPGSDGTVAS